MSPVEWGDIAIYHLSLRGNAYSRIHWLGSTPKAIYPINPDQVQARAGSDGAAEYVHTDSTGKVTVYDARDILHFKGLSTGGLTGIDPITANREILGYAQATAEFGARFFAANATPGGVIEVPAKMDDEVARAFVDAWKDAQGGDNQHSVALLDAGMSFKALSISPANSQYLEGRQFNRIEVGAMFRIPPHKLGDLGSANYSNLVEQNQDFINSTLLPIGTRFEQEIQRKLIPASAWGTDYVEHNYNALLQGDPVARYTAYGSLWDRGVLNADEIRARENMNAQPDDQGKTYWIPLNFAPADAERTPQPTPLPPTRAVTPELETRSKSKAAKQRRVLTDSYAGLLEDALRRVVRKESQDIKAAVKRTVDTRSTANLKDWLEDYAQDTEYTTKQLTPVFAAFAAAVGPQALDEVQGDYELTPDMQDWITGYIARFAEQHANKTVGQITKLITEIEAEELVQAINQRLEEWQAGIGDTGTTRAGKIAAQESITFGEKLARTALIAAGVTRFVWHTNGSDTCPLCQELNGRVVGAATAFVPAGDTIDSDTTGPITRKTDVMQPPLHPGCECSVHPE